MYLVLLKKTLSVTMVLKIIDIEFSSAKVSDSEEHTCFLIKLGLRNKQIAQSMGITPNSVIKTKQRLRQKLKGLPADEDLTRWLQLLGEPLDKLPPGHMMFLGEHSAEDKETKIR